MSNNPLDIELAKAEAVISERTGLSFPVKMKGIFYKSLESAGKELGYPDLMDFLKWLSSAKPDKIQTDIIGRHMTISETYFWREPNLFRALTREILPDLQKLKDNKKQLRIWSAGCSSGEEPYSIAIAIMESIPGIKDWDIKIIGTDLNPLVIEKANAGIYGQWSFRNTPCWLRRKYFIQLKDKCLQIRPEVKKMVTFSCQNLAEISSPPGGELIDIIFCRNVLMYFNAEQIKRSVSSFHNSLAEGGWMIVSSCELSSETFRQFKNVVFPGAVCYQKRALSSSSATDPQKGTGMKRDLLSDSPGYLPGLQKGDLAPLLSNPDQFAEIAIANNTHTKSRNNRPGYKLSDVTSAPEPDIIVLTPEQKENKISSLAGAGKLEEALNECNEAIAISKLNMRLYYLKASVLQEMNKNAEALSSLRQALYIKPDHAIGHFSIGSIFMKNGEYTKATQHFRNVLDLTKDLLDDKILPDSEGMSLGLIRETINSTLKI